EPGAVGDLQAVERRRLPERGGHQVVRLEIRVAWRRRLQSHPLEPRPDEVGGGTVLLRISQPAAQRVAGQEEQIRAQILLADRVVLRRPLLRDDRREESQHARGGEQAFQHEDLSTYSVRVWSG